MSRRTAALALVACLIGGGVSVRILVGALMWGDWTTVFWAGMAYTGWLTGALMCIAVLAGWRDDA